ncbi:MAG: hypothetical protein ABI472_18435 [Ginsengibacter sp.]
MLTIAAIITWITTAGKFLKQTGGDSAIEEGAKSVFSWLKGKFTRPSEQSKIEEVETDPDNEDMIKKLTQLLEDLQADDEQKFMELNEKIKDFEKLVGDKMPATAESINKNINSNIISRATIYGSVTQGNTYNTGKKDT